MYSYIEVLTIRSAQISALRDGQLCDWLRQYLRSCYPAKVKKLGREALIELVRVSYQQASRQGFAEPDQLRKYVHISFLLGSGFEERFAWAAQIMGNADYNSELARLRALEDAALQHFKARAAAARS